MSFQYQNILVEDQAGIRTISFNRPKALNALNKPTLEELDDLLSKTAKDTNIGVVILTGAGGKAFVAGADISQMSSFSSVEATQFAELGHRVFQAIESLPQPVIAAVNGFALGGGTELALSCDFIYASEKAKFGQPEVKLGLIPGFGGTQRLMRKVPIGIARELIYTGEMINAEEALRIGLVNRVISVEELMPTVIKIAQKILKKSHIAVQAAKKAMLQGADRVLEEANQIEIGSFAALFDTDHPKEGTEAFLQKRTPNFSDAPGSNKE